MQENQKDTGDEKLLILPLGEESKKITQVISNDTARQIIELLADKPLSASDIAERLSSPLTTVTYNLENLEKVGLIKVERIKYSEKGREVKIFAPVRKLIVVVPDKTDKKSVTDILRKYLGVILAAVFASSLMEFIVRKSGTSLIQMSEIAGAPAPESGIPEPVPTPVPAAVLDESIKGDEMLYRGLIPSATPTPVPVSIDPTASAATTPLPTSMPIYDALNTSTGSPAPVQPQILEKGAAGMPDIFAQIADTIAAHPGIVFLLGCLFVVSLLVIMDLGRKKKNS